PLLGLGLAAAALEPALPAAALGLGFVNGWLAAYLAACARLVGGLPHAQVTSWSGLGLLFGVPALAVLALRAGDRHRRLLAALTACLGLFAAGWRLLPHHPPPPTGLRITFLDVGQGDAVLLQTRRAAILVDQGPPEGRVAEQLERLGVRRLAMLVLTHPQRDHVGGAEEVLERIAVDVVLDPRLPVPSPYEASALAAARRRDVPVVVARAGRAYAVGRLRLRVLWPDGPGPRVDDPNRHATVLHVSYGSVDALLTADAESDVTVPLRPPPVEILKIAHHGSADALLPELLRLVRPRVAVISVGKRNDYGHPTPSTLATLESAPGLAVYRTDVDGRITIDSDGDRFQVRDER
ncbi:MAG: ComEC/Rec2 family competence protein, partial [Gaiellaceae bacterium]